MIFKWLFGKRERGDAESAAPSPKDAKPESLIVGLGNPGKKYAGTRHNIGFEAVDELRAALGDGVSPPKEICEAECGTAARGAKTILLAKPYTYMNLSGDAVGALVGKYKLTPDKCLVIVDDFNIPLGKIRFRKDGSHGGHNGLKSISAAIGDGYPRLRIGIGPLPNGIRVIDFVLGRFCDEELDDVKTVVKTAAEAVAFMIDNDIDAAMNKYN